MKTASTQLSCVALAAGLLLALGACKQAPAQRVPSCPGSADAAVADPWPFSVRTREALRGLGFFHPGIEWKDFQHKGMDLAVGIETWPTDGASYIDVHAYVYNRAFQEWRRFVAVQIRGAGQLELKLDEAAGTLTALGAANNDLRGKPLMTFDLRAVYDDR